MQTTTIKHNQQTKQSLVHKVPSGVAILSHVCGDAAIVHPQPFMIGVVCCLFGMENLVRQGALCL